MSQNDGLDSELESFRRQWLSEVSSRPGESSSSHRGPVDDLTLASLSLSAGPPRSLNNGPPSPTTSRKQANEDGADYLPGLSFDEPAPPTTQLSGDTVASKSKEKKKLVSALDHYEEAMEKESLGNMGESLKLYRQAYRLDNRVEKRYREKHYPDGVPSSSSKAPAKDKDVETSTSNQLEPTEPETKPLAIKELMASFVSSVIVPTPPDVEGSPAPPCPIAKLPDELLIHIMRDTALDNVADFVRLSLVCKHLAYLVATEQRIWRRVCVGPEFGFAGMQYRWASPIQWDRAQIEAESDIEYYDEEPDHVDEDGNLISPREIVQRRRAEAHAITISLTPSIYPTWKSMFRRRPRIRFNGCYISTVNYIRTGQASTNQSTWGGSPVHIVTYYRYLRFFRDGSLISLLTTNEPTDIVHHLSQEALLLHRKSAHSHLASSVMNLAHRGRWRMSPPGVGPQQNVSRHGSDMAVSSGEGDIFVETEGVGTKYLYRMDLTLSSAGKSTSTRNNKLIWRRFYSYNKLTDDWGEFGLKNDRPFFFSRVKSYGIY